MTAPSAETPSWHERVVTAVRFELGPGTFDARLLLDLDVPAAEPAAATEPKPRQTVTFHDVSDLMVAIDMGDTGGRHLMHELVVGDVVCTPLPVRPGARPNHRWVIGLAWPAGGHLTFGATGWTVS